MIGRDGEAIGARRDDQGEPRLEWSCEARLSRACVSIGESLIYELDVVAFDGDVHLWRILDNSGDLVLQNASLCAHREAKRACERAAARLLQGPIDVINGPPRRSCAMTRCGRLAEPGYSTCEKHEMRSEIDPDGAVIRMTVADRREAASGATECSGAKP